MKDKCLFVLLIGALIWCAFEPSLSGSYQLADALTLGLLGGASLIGSGINYLASDETNSVNSALTHEQMKWQSEENERDRNFQSYMVPYTLYQQQKFKSNDPLIMRNAYERAGINPYFALGGIQGSSGSSAGTPSSHSVGGIPIPQFQSPLGAFGGSLQNTLSLLSQLTAIEGAQIDNKNKQAMFDTQFNLWRSQAENYQKLGNVYDKQSGNLFLDWLRKSKTLESNVQGDFAENLTKQIEAQSQRQILAGLVLDNKIKEIDLKFRGALNEQQLNQLKAVTSQAYAAAADYNMSAKERAATINVLGKQAENIVAGTELTKANTEEAKYWNEFRRSFKPEIFHYELERKAADIGLINTQSERYQHLDNPIQNYSPLFTGAAAAGLGAGIGAYSRYSPKPPRIGFKHY